MFSPTVADVIHFLTEQYNQGIGYSAMSSVRSALSTFIYLDGQPAGSHPIIRRFLKGVFNLRPVFPKNETIWDTNIVLRYLKKLSPVKKLNFKLLTLKFVMLLSLLTGQRSQTLHLLNLKDLVITKKGFKMKIGEMLKHSRPGKHLDLLTVKAYAPDRRLCPLTVLLEYLKRTVKLRKSERLLVGIIKPHGSVSSATVARWIKTVMIYSGVDTKLFSAHSTRGASTSKAAFDNVPITSIMKTAGWSQEQTFARYYNKPISNAGKFGTTILDSAK